MNIFSKISAAITLLLLFTTVGSNAASVESEVSDTDTVVIGAASEKIILRVTGYKNLNGSENSYGNVFASRTSAVGQLAITFGSEHDPKVTVQSVGGGNYSYRLTGTIKNSEGDQYNVSMSGINGKVTANGTTWGLVLTGSNILNGQLTPSVNQKLKPGVYPISVRAALYQQ
ncbi:hypothetical protein [Pantoea agglomerans]|uniref:Uncharacterized protein n=1 Tax=Enterobacter agglomerans TaxID=549 RepID=A0ACC5PMD0_ENTAG|nr:hypothetical protein [Pantoea agglomerans]MBD8126060.1 hypothetical protein [Pantoea agglomerans]MBD8153352.1 hypothetical protein [Pantoea agglomerans]MBD8245135.1 hypothetical protein [Pantoea agglomerans]NEG82081.1 hypothetical protein [Pantoea agglomerans]